MFNGYWKRLVYFVNIIRNEVVWINSSELIIIPYESIIFHNYILYIIN